MSKSLFCRDCENIVMNAILYILDFTSEVHYTSIFLSITSIPSKRIPIELTLNLIFWPCKKK